MLDLSYKDEFGKIIAAFRTLPDSLQSSPVAFTHFVNAVFTQERTDSELYREAVSRMAQVFANRPYTLAYWQFEDAERHRVRAGLEVHRTKLLELLDDYELLGD